MRTRRPSRRGHFAVGYLQAQAGRILPMGFSRDGETRDIVPQYVISVNDARSYLTAALTGLGVAQLPLFMVREALADGRLIRVLPMWQHEPLPLYVVYPQTQHLSNKVRVFVNWLVGLMRDIDK